LRASLIKNRSLEETQVLKLKPQLMQQKIKRRNKEQRTRSLRLVKRENSQRKS
jgi:hypothetical protein